MTMFLWNSRFFDSIQWSRDGALSQTTKVWNALRLQRYVSIVLVITLLLLLELEEVKRPQSFI